MVRLLSIILIMNNSLEQRFFRLLSEESLRKVSASESTEAIEELATHLADFSINEQDYSILLRYFSFGLHHLKSYRVRFEQEKIPYLHLIDEAMGLLNNEMCIIKMAYRVFIILAVIVLLSFSSSRCICNTLARTVLIYWFNSVAIRSFPLEHSFF